MVNTDIYSKPGVLKISHSLLLDKTFDALIVWDAIDPTNGTYYAVADDGKIHRRTTLGVWSVIPGHGTTAGIGLGLAIWKGYLFYAHETLIDVYALPTSPNGDAGTWYNSWEAGNPLKATFFSHPMMAGQDDFLYIGDINYVHTLNEFTVFKPDVSATYTYNYRDLEIRSDYTITSLEEQGSLIAIGASIEALNIADIFIWDGTSDSFSLNGTIRLVEDGLKMVKNVNNVLFAIAGSGIPIISQAVTSQSREVKRFNNMEFIVAGSRTELYASAIEYKEGEIMFGIGGIACRPLGVYALRNNAYVLRHVISTGNTGLENRVNIGTVRTINRNEILVSWRDDRTGINYGVDVLSRFFYTGYKCFSESQLYAVATDDDPITYEKCQFRLSKALKAGDKVKVEARYDLDGAYTQICEIDTVTTPLLIGRSVHDVKVSNLGKFKNIQLKVSLDVASNALFSPELLSIALT